MKKTRPNFLKTVKFMPPRTKIPKKGSLLCRKRMRSQVPRIVKSRHSPKMQKLVKKEDDLHLRKGIRFEISDSVRSVSQKSALKR